MSDQGQSADESAPDADGYRTQSRDTDAVFERVVFDRWRSMDASEKGEVIDAMTRDADALTRAGVRLRHPSAGDREVEMRVFALRLGRDWMLRAYGWDPEVEGW